MLCYRLCCFSFRLAFSRFHFRLSVMFPFGVTFIFTALTLSHAVIRKERRNRLDSTLSAQHLQTWVVTDTLRLYIVFCLVQVSVFLSRWLHIKIITTWLIFQWMQLLGNCKFFVMRYNVWVCIVKFVSEQHNTQPQIMLKKLLNIVKYSAWGHNINFSSSSVDVGFYFVYLLLL